MGAYGFLIIVPCCCGEPFLHDISAEAICIFSFLFCSSWLASYHTVVKFNECLVSFVLPRFYQNHLRYHWSFLRNVVTDCQNKEWLPERNVHWVRLRFFLERVCKCAFFFFPRNPTSHFIMFVSDQDNWLLSHISNRTWRICACNFH